MIATVWSIQIQHVAEETLDVCGDKSQALQVLESFLARNWFRMAGMPMPSDVNAAAIKYFSERPDESYVLASHQVEIPDAA